MRGIMQIIMLSTAARTGFSITMVFQTSRNPATDTQPRTTQHSILTTFLTMVQCLSSSTMEAIVHRALKSTMGTLAISQMLVKSNKSCR